MRLPNVCNTKSFNHRHHHHDWRRSHRRLLAVRTKHCACLTGYSKINISEWNNYSNHEQRRRRIESYRIYGWLTCGSWSVAASRLLFFTYFEIADLLEYTYINFLFFYFISFCFSWRIVSYASDFLPNMYANEPSFAELKYCVEQSNARSFFKRPL